MGPAYHDEDLIFAKPDGTAIPPWLFSSAFRNFMKRSGVRRIRFHDLRDTHASLLAKARSDRGDLEAPGSQRHQHHVRPLHHGLP